MTERPVLITGGAGFIGGAIGARIVARDRDVVVLDDLSSGRPDRVPSPARLIVADVADSSVIDQVIALAPSVIVHCAAQTSVPRSVADPESDQRINCVGTANVALAAARAGARLIFLSSGGAVYGETGAEGASESAAPAPTSPYGEHKLAAEAIVSESRAPYAIARLANVFGPGQRSGLEGGVVATFLSKVVAGEPVTVDGSGEQKRDFVWVEDVADAVLRMIDSTFSGTWNIGTGRATSILDLLQLVEEAVGVRVERHFRGRRPGDVFCSCLRPERARQELGWKPTTSLESGLLSYLALEAITAPPALPGPSGA